MAKTESTVEQILVPEPLTGLLRVDIEGQTPYLCGALHIEAIHAMYSDKPKQKNHLTPQEAADERTYWLGDSPAAKASAFKKCIVSAARHFEHDKSINMTRVRGLVFVLGGEAELIPLAGKVSLREDGVREGTAPKVRYRNEIWPWSAQLEIEYAYDQISAETVVQLLVNGGRLYGVGDWRPEKGGTFGRFGIVSAQK